MHAYPSSPTSSTCVVECSPETWQGLGLDTLDSEQGLRLLEQVFADVLAGGRLFGQSRAEPSRWQRFQHLTNQTWHHGNVVLVGDAAHAAHFTMASGTRQALKDAVYLANALAAQPDVAGALRAYDERRRPSAERLVASGRRRAERWERMDDLLEREVLDFLHGRSGRRSEAELRRRRPLYRAQQLGAVRLAQRRVGSARRWYRARQSWPRDDGATAVPAASVTDRIPAAPPTQPVPSDG
jgi:2-polyprenyl-6-methoxyphenol hydroxylase-like FAD-dependent oxidoreductase